MSKKNSTKTRNLTDTTLMTQKGEDLTGFIEACARRHNTLVIEPFAHDFALFYPKWDITCGGKFGVAGLLTSDKGSVLYDVPMQTADEVSTAMESGLMAVYGGNPYFVSPQFVSEICRSANLKEEAPSPEWNAYFLHCFPEEMRAGYQMVVRREPGQIPVLVAMSRIRRKYSDPAEIATLFSARQAFSVDSWIMTDLTFRVIEALPNTVGGCRAAVRFSDPTWGGGLTAEAGLVTSAGFFIPCGKQNTFYVNHLCMVSDSAEFVLCKAEQAAFSLSTEISRLNVCKCGNVADFWEKEAPWAKAKKNASMFVSAEEIREAANNCTNAAEACQVLMTAIDGTSSKIKSLRQWVFTDILLNFLNSFEKGNKEIVKTA